MNARIPFLACLAGALFPAACGGSVASIASDAGPPVEAGLPSDAAPVLSCGTLRTAGPVQRVSNAGTPADELASASSWPSGGLIGWLSYNGQPSGGVDAFHLTRLGPYAAPVPGPPPATSLPVLLQGASSAMGSTHGALVGTDANATCQFVPLDVSGAPAGATIAVGPGRCSSLRATASGFDLLVDSSSGLMLITTDLMGNATGSVALDAENVPLATFVRATLDDGTFLVASTPENDSNCLCPTSASIQHFSSSGQALAAGHVVGSVWPESRPALTPIAGGALFVAASDGIASVAVQPLDENGDAAGKPVMLDATDAGPVESLAIDAARIGNDVAIVAWSRSTSTSDASVTAQAVSSTGAPLSAPVVVAATGGGRNVRVSPAPTGAVTGAVTGAIVSWDGPLASPNVIQAVPLACGP